jgi:hypothetical protein
MTAIPIDPAYQSQTSQRRGVATFFWVISMLASILGGLIGVGGSLLANGAPQEAAAAAIGCIVVIAPYVFARAVDELTK